MVKPAADGGTKGGEDCPVGMDTTDAGDWQVLLSMTLWCKQCA